MMMMMMKQAEGFFYCLFEKNNEKKCEGSMRGKDIIIGTSG